MRDQNAFPFEKVFPDEFRSPWWYACSMSRHVVLSLENARTVQHAETPTTVLSSSNSQLFMRWLFQTPLVQKPPVNPERQAVNNSPLLYITPHLADRFLLQIQRIHLTIYAKGITFSMVASTRVQNRMFSVIMWGYILFLYSCQLAGFRIPVSVIRSLMHRLLCRQRAPGRGQTVLMDYLAGHWR